MHLSLKFIPLVKNSGSGVKPTLRCGICIYVRDFTENSIEFSCHYRAVIKPDNISDRYKMKKKDILVGGKWCSGFEVNSSKYKRLA